ncbi:MAG: hypothetical protein AAGA46_03230 [Cyanobacteria bacterium P01_F01_bin.13]
MAAPTTTAQGIVLLLGGYTLTITQFGRYPGRYPRIDGAYTSIERSIAGASARRGPRSRFALWNFDAKLSLAQQETLRRMEGAYWGNRQAWTLYDYTNYWSENGTSNTRAIAPNSTSASDGTTILYYPRWQAEPTEQSGFEFTEQSDGFDLVSFQFTETEVVAA